MCDDLDLLKTQSKITLSLLPHTLLEVREEINFAAAARLKEIIGQLGNPNQNIHKSCWPEKQKEKPKSDFKVYVTPGETMQEYNIMGYNFNLRYNNTT